MAVFQKIQSLFVIISMISMLFASFTSQAVLVPTVVSNAAIGVEETNATLQGTLTDDGGENCIVGFEYGPTVLYENKEQLNYIYAAGNTKKIYKYWISNLTKKTETVTSTGTINALAQDSIFIYSGGDDGLISQYWKSNMTLRANASYGAYIYALIQDDDYVYAGGFSVNKVYQYWKSNMTKRAETESYGGTIRSLAIDDDCIYAGGQINQTVKQYWKSNMTLRKFSKYFNNNILCLVVDDTYVYGGGAGVESKVKQYWKSNMTYKQQTEMYGLPTGPINELAQDDTYIYAGGLIGSTPYTTSNVTKYYKLNMTKKENTTIAYGGGIWGLTADDNFIYVGGTTNQTIKQYWKGNMTLKCYSENYDNTIQAVSLRTYITGDNLFFDVGGLIPGKLHHYRTYATNNEGTANGEDKIFLTKPEAPMNLAAQTNSSSLIYLTWTKGIGANYTKILRKTDGIPSKNSTDGITVYNGTGASCENSGLSPSTSYYYYAWSFAIWTDEVTLNQWSDLNGSAMNTTYAKINHGVILYNESPRNGTKGVSKVLKEWSVVIEDLDGNLFNWSIETIPVIGNNSGWFDSNGTKNVSLSGLDFDTNYIIIVNVSENNTKETFWFKTRKITSKKITTEPPIQEKPKDTSSNKLPEEWFILMVIGIFALVAKFKIGNKRRKPFK